MSIARPLASFVARHVLLSLALLGGLLPTALRAQSAEPARLGATVRALVAPPDGWRQGRLVAFDSVKLRLRESDGSGLEHIIALASIRRLEMRHPSRNRAIRAVGFGFLGAVVGATIGGTVGAAGTQCSNCDGDSGIGALLGVPLGGAVGGVVGVAVGGKSGGRWVPARLPHWDPTAPAANPPAAGAPGSP